MLALGIGTEYPKPLSPAPLMYVADTDGNVLESWGTGAAVHAHGLNIINDEIYLCDKYDSVLFKYTLDGKVLQMLGRRGMHSDTGCEKNGAPVPRAGGPFNQPDDFTVSPWGDYYVADGMRNARVHRFDNGGHLIQSWGQWGSNPGDLKTPHAVLATPDRKLYVCDRMNNRVQVFSPEGKVLGIWGDLQWPCNIVITPEGDFAIGEDPGKHGDPNSAGRQSGIRIYDKDGESVSDLEVGPTHWMAIDSVGNIYTATHRSVNKLVRL